MESHNTTRILLIIVSTLTSIINTNPVYLYEGSTCHFNEHHMGVCRSADSCPSVIRDLKENYMRPDYKRRHFKRCGFDNFKEIVCCPETDNIEKYDSSDDKYKFPDEGSKTDDQKINPSIVTKTSEVRKADRACDEYTKQVPAALELYILGGEAAKQGEFAHMAALGYQTEKGLDFECGGSLITMDYVLTAAHCVVTLDDIKPTVVRIGTISIEDTSDSSDNDYKVEKIIVHPAYARALKYNDLALLKLDRPVTITGDAHPACLYTKDDDPPGRIIVTGWGQTSLLLTDSKSKVLRKANLTAVPWTDCNPIYTETRDRKLPNGITAEQLCAVDVGGTMDSCRGDSGGPIQIPTNVDGMYKVIGVTSFGKGCGDAIPAIYVRVSKYVDWIESIVWP